MTEPSYFERLYADSGDPWRLSSSAYEARKYALTMAALPRPRYVRAFEPGCSIGVLTSLLAARCDELVAWDGAAAAVEQARERTSGSVVIAGQHRVPTDWPDGNFDLVVLSELLYYLDVGQRRRTLDLAVRSLSAGGHLVAVHWRHAFAEAPSNGDEVHAEVNASPGVMRVVQHVEPDFLLDVHEVRGQSPGRR